jgi:hypothetical protein
MSARIEEEIRECSLNFCKEASDSLITGVFWSRTTHLIVDRPEVDVSFHLLSGNPTG